MIHARVGSRGKSKANARAESSKRVEESSCNALLRGWQTRHDVHVGHSELEIGADDSQTEGGEEKLPVRVADRVVESTVECKRGCECKGTNGHEKPITDTMHDQSGNGIDQCADDSLGEEAKSDAEGVYAFDLLEVESCPKRISREASEAKTQYDNELQRSAIVK